MKKFWWSYESILVIDLLFMKSKSFQMNVFNYWKTSCKTIWINWETLLNPRYHLTNFHCFTHSIFKSYFRVNLFEKLILNEFHHLYPNGVKEMFTIHSCLLSSFTLLMGNIHFKLIILINFWHRALFYILLIISKDQKNVKKWLK